jgi:type II secretory pathway component GspD/PulD (secretin)
MANIPKRLILVIGIPSVFLFMTGAAPAQEHKIMSVNGRSVVVSTASGAAAPVMVAPQGARPPGAPGGPGRPPASSKGKPSPPSGKPADSKKPDDKDKAKDSEKKGGDKKEDEAVETKQRPTEPPKPADPEELEVLPDKDGKVEFNFTGQPWEGVLKWLASVSGKSLDWQEMPGGYLNLVTQRSYTLDEARDLINLHLLARGFTLLGEEEILSVANIKKLNPGMVPRVSPDQLSERLPHEFVKVSFALDWLMADSAVEELKPMLSPNGKLTALKTTNRLEAIDAVVNLREILEILKEEQSDTGLERVFREFKLHHSDCEEVLKHLETLLGIEKKPAGATMTKQQMEAAKRAAMQAQQANKGKPPAPKEKTKVNLAANRRKNSILVNAPPDRMAFIEKAIETLDMPSEEAGSLLRNPDRMQIYRLESIQAETLIKTLEELGDLDFFTKLEVDQENNAIVAYASLADHVMIRSLIKKLDNGSRRFEAIQLRQLRAESVAEVIDFTMGGGKEKKEKKQESSGTSSRYFSPFFSSGRSPSSPKSRSGEHRDGFRVDADARNNTLHLWCNEFELQKVQDLLDSMRQVDREDGEPHTVEVHRLVSIDPQVLVATLNDMNHLEYHSKLEVDEENRSIVAYATKADHDKIRSLIKELDGSGRQFEVIQLRRLEADYVAGTIEFMMTGKEDKQQSGYTRIYYSSYGGYGPSNAQGKKKDDAFRVDADVEFNRLLVWANEIELDEVKNLLVKLGEIPADGGDPRTIRVIDTLPPDEVERILERIRKAWPSVAPNQLLLDSDDKPADESKDDSEDASGEKKPKPAATPEKKSTAGASRHEPAYAGVESTPSAVRLVRYDPPAAEENAGQKSAAEAPTADKPSPQDKPDKLPPVSITRGPDGRLVISSEDTKALDRLEQLMAELTPPREDYEIFRLKHAWAYSVAFTLEDIFKEGEDEGQRRSPYSWGWYGYDRGDSSGDSSVRLSKRRPLKFISDSDSNSILVHGADAGQLAKITKLIEFYDQPEPTDSQSIRKTEIVQLRYARASMVAEAVKEVYRDLLSANDKALQRNQQASAPREMYIWNTDDSDGDGERMPRFKGLLSIGVDDLSNTLVISSPTFLFDDVIKIIEALDEAAAPTTTTVRVLQMGQGVSAQHVQQVLSNVLGGKSSRGKSPPRPPGSEQPGPPKSNGPKRDR